jgi:hypothetical protein
MVAALQRVPQHCGVIDREFFHPTVATCERHRAGALCGPVIDWRSDRLAGFRIDVLAHSFGPHRRPSCIDKR